VAGAPSTSRVEAATATFGTVRAPDTRSYGQAATEALRAVGVELFPWQADVLDQWLEVDELDRLTRTTAGLIVPRRNGKSWLVAARILFGIVHLGELRWTYSAHRMDTAREVFDTMRAMCRHPLLEPLVDKVHLAHGKEAIAFTNGGRFSIRTRTGHGGRGMEVDGLVIDEALVLDADSTSALLPLTAKAAAGGRGQVIYASSAGSQSEESAILLGLRDRGRAAAGTAGDGFAYHEWSSERTDDLDDPATWRAANPSLGTPVLDERFIADARGRMSVEAFMREHLGVWSDTAGLPVIDPAVWRELAVDAELEHEPGCWLTFDLAPDRTSARVLAFTRALDGRLLVSCIDSLEDQLGIEGDWYAQRIVGLAQLYDPEVIGFDRLTGAHVESVLAGHGWKDRLRPMTGGRLANGLASLVAAVRLGQLAHDGHPDVEADLARAVGKPFGDGGLILSRKDANGGPIAAGVCLEAGVYLSTDQLVV
jgi:Probable DNA packing protein, N-terminus